MALGAALTSPFQTPDEARRLLAVALERAGIDDDGVREAMMATYVTAARVAAPPSVSPFPEIDQDAWGLCLQLAKLESSATKPPLRFKRDNPGGDWLEHEKRRCHEAPRREHGAPGRFGEVTGWFTEDVLVPVAKLAAVPGLNGEQLNVRQGSLDWLVENMGASVRLPSAKGDNDAIEDCPFLQIDHEGQPWINEGNHRIMAAHALKWSHMPVTIRYFSGGEDRATEWAPEKLLADHERLSREPRIAPRREHQDWERIARDNAFHSWFAGSRVVDRDGKPLVVYHGTAANIERFKVPRDGVYFTSSPQMASDYAENSAYKRRGPAANVVPAYLKIGNPRVVDMSGETFSDHVFRRETESAKLAGNDGLILRNVDDSLAHATPVVSDVYVVFDDAQIKSAIGNRGTFDPANSDIRYAFADAVENSETVPIALDGFEYFEARALADSRVLFTGTAKVGGQRYFANIRVSRREDGTPRIGLGDYSFETFTGKAVRGAANVKLEELMERALDAARSWVERDAPAVSSQTEAPEFKRWFGDSKVVDAEGKPVVVYHGTPMSFTKFNTFPVYFTDDAQAAAGYASGQYAPPENEAGPNVMPVYLSLKNPKVFTAEELHKLIPADEEDVNSIEWSDFDNLADSLEKEGYDGVILKGIVDYAGGQGEGREWRAYTQYVAFSPEQIKSAIGNRGTFDLASPDIRYAFAAAAERLDANPWMGQSTPAVGPKTATPEFKRWFAESKVIDSEGKPLLVYHGTRRDFSAFDAAAEPANPWLLGNDNKNGFFFTSNPGYRSDMGRWSGAAGFAGTAQVDGETVAASGANIMPVYLSIQSPYRMSADEYRERGARPDFKEELEALGYDGVQVGEETFIAFNPAQIKSAVGNVGTFDLANPDIRYAFADGEPVFYSRLARALPAMSKVADKSGMILPAQAKAWLAARQREGRFKQDELAWSGLLDWLDLQRDKVAVAAVEQFVRDHGVRVTETVLGGTLDGGPVRQALEEDLRLYGYRVEDDSFGLPGDVIVRRLSDGEPIAETDPLPSQVEDLVRRWVAAGEVADATGTKFSKWQLIGSKQGYRELLLTLPLRRPAPLTELPDGFVISMDHQSDPENPYTVIPPGQIHGQPYMGRHPDEASARAAALGRLNRERDAAAEADGFRASHFEDVPNVIAHVRFNERADADGRRVLFIEEIQSDWGQKGKKEGFAADTTDWTAELTNPGGGFNKWVVKDASGKKVADIVGGTKEAALQKAAGEIPSAPFVTDTKAWVAVALKRMARYAAENGFDVIGWTTGEQQAKRYSLTQVVDYIGWAPRGGDGRFVSMSLNGTNPVQLLVNRDGKAIVAKGGLSGAEGKQLDEIVGKDVASKIMSEPSGELAGEQLNIGGDGMKAFYDEIVPQVASDLLKQVGGNSKLATVRLDVTDYGKRGKPPADWKPEYAVFNDQPGFAITPAMRAQVLGGLPLFWQWPSTPAEFGGMTPETLRLNIDAQFGRGFADKLLATGDFVFLHREAELPPHLRHPRGGIAGLYDELSDKTYLVAEWICPEMLRGMMLHEIGVHFGMTQILGARAQVLFAQARRLAEEGDPAAVRALARVPRDTKEHLVNEELVAYLVGDLADRKLSVVQTATSRIKTFFFELGADVKLNAVDMTVLAAGCLKRCANGNRRPSFSFARDVVGLLRRGASALVSMRPQAPGVRYAFAGAAAKSGDRSLLARAIALSEPFSDAERSRYVDLEDRYDVLSDVEVAEYEALSERVDARFDPDLVRQRTGWFRGYDDKWRFEIDDSEARLEMSYADYERYREGHPITGDYPHLFLSDVLRHPALFEAYPDLRWVRVFYDPNIPEERGAYYRPSDNMIGLAPCADDGESLRRLIHEVQHAVQHVEGFAVGGSLSGLRRQSNASEIFGAAQLEYREIKQSRPELVAAWEKVRSHRDQMAEKYRVSMFGEDGNFDEHAERRLHKMLMTEEERAHQRSLVDAYAEHLDGSDVAKRFADVLGRLRYAMIDQNGRGGVQHVSARDQYLCLAGEIEARDVEARMRWQGNERRAKPPYQSQGIPHEQVIVRFAPRAAASPRADLVLEP